MPDIKLGTLRNGYCVYWIGEDGQRRRYQLASRDIEGAKAEAVEVYRAKTYSSRPKHPTIAEIWQAHRDDLGDRPSGVTMSYTGKAILPFFGSYRPDDIDKRLCREYAAEREKQGKSQGTIHTELGHLQMALNAFLGRDAPRLWRPQKPQTDKRILDPGEARRLIEATDTPHTRLALILLLGTAARVSAVLDLTWDRVDFDQGVIHFPLSDAQTRKGRARPPMNASVRAALSAAHSARISDHVVEYAGGPIKSIRTGFVAAVRRAGIGHVRIHDLRHTAAVTMLSHGIPLEMVSQMLGHSNTTVTFSTYARYLPQHMQKAADVLDFMSMKRKA